MFETPLLKIHAYLVKSLFSSLGIDQEKILRLSEQMFENLYFKSHPCQIKQF